MSEANTTRKFVTPVIAALVLAGGLAATTLASGAHAADGATTETTKVEAGRELFNTWSCSACHTLTDAGSSGAVGPSLDNPKLTRDFIIARITSGSGPMPSFGGQIDDEDIAKLADYIVTVNHPAAAAPATH